MADASHSDLIAQFTGVTGTNTERAKFYLEAAAWNLEVALSSFYDAGDAGEAEEAEIEELAIPEAVPPAQPIRTPAEPPSSNPRISTFSQMQQDESGSSSEEEGQAFYAGGSVHSGQQVIGPPRKKVSAAKLVETMFKAAKEHGAESVEGETSGSSGRSLPSFRGTGYRLGETEDAPSAMVQGADATMGPKQMNVVLKLWKNGFSVDDGEVREYDDPANKDFLSSIHRGEIPRELLRLSKGGEVNLNMEDHRGEDFVQTRRTTKAFTGEGYKLGSPTPNIVGAAAAGAASSGSGESDEASAKAAVQVDISQPTTNLQIRLADGTRLVAKFNHTHTVGDVRTYITTAHSQFAGTNFILMTTFPSTELTDETKTLAEAKLLNAVLVQRLK